MTEPGRAGSLVSFVVRTMTVSDRLRISNFRSCLKGLLVPRIRRYSTVDEGGGDDQGGGGDEGGDDGEGGDGTLAVVNYSPNQ